MSKPRWQDYEGEELKRAFVRRSALPLALLMLPGLLAPRWGWGASPAVLGQVASLDGRGFLNGAPAAAHATLFAGDRLSTAKDTRAVLDFGADGQARLEGSTRVALAQAPDGARLSLLAGRLTLRQNPGRQLRVGLPGAEIRLSSPAHGAALCEIALAAESWVTCARGEAHILQAGAADPVVVPVGYRARARPAPRPNEEDDDDDDRALVIWTVGGLGATATILPIVILAGDDERPVVSPSAP